MQPKSQQVLWGHGEGGKDKFILKCIQKGKESGIESQKFERLTYPDLKTL